MNLNAPGSVQSGDTLIAVIALNGTTANRVNAPAGWQTLPGYPLPGDGNIVKSVWIFQKQADSSLNNAFTFSKTNAGGVLVAYRGARIVRETHRNTANFSANLVAPAIDTVKNALVLRIVSLSPVNHARGVVGLAALNLRYDTGAILGFPLYIADALQTQTGSSGEASFKVKDESGATYAEVGTGITLALEP